MVRSMYVSFLGIQPPKNQTLKCNFFQPPLTQTRARSIVETCINIEIFDANEKRTSSKKFLLPKGVSPEL